QPRSNPPSAIKGTHENNTSSLKLGAAKAKIANIGKMNNVRNVITKEAAEVTFRQTGNSLRGIFSHPLRARPSSTRTPIASPTSQSNLSIITSRFWDITFALLPLSTQDPVHRLARLVLHQGVYLCDRN